MQSRKQGSNRTGRSTDKSPGGQRANAGTLRIIGGDWRGRRLSFPALEGLRPTADRVRETLFNWLAPRIHGARCLDMFAGSGALGLEALSRGAAHCDFLEQQPVAANTIREHLRTLEAKGRAQVIGGDALGYSACPKEAPNEKTCESNGYDIVFIDPPFADTMTQNALQHLLKAELLAQDARIYLELGRSQPLPILAPEFEVLKDKTAGDVRYLLLAPKGLA